VERVGVSEHRHGRRTEETVAVVVTTYDHARFLDGALRSVLGQTATVDEVIVVDDGSHDHPEDVVHRFPGVRLVSQANRGLAAARNVGWRTARADLVAFLDADDRLAPDAVASNRAALGAAPEAALAYGRYVLVDAATARVTEPRPQPDATYRRLLDRNVIEMHGTVLYRRAALEAIGGFDERLSATEDWDAYLRLARRHPLARTDDVVAEYWRHGANMSRRPSVMLRGASTVLRTQVPDAEALGFGDVVRRSLRARRDLYCGDWWDQVLVAGARRRPVRPLLADVPALAAMAPVSFVLAPWRVGAHKCRGLARGSGRVGRRGSG
jgi:glycosyltransferase involved in cell wall biosynthesis